MKKIFISALTVGLFLVSGCEAPEQQIFDEIPRATALATKDPTALAAFAAAAYKPLVGTWGAHNSLWSMQEIASDEMVIAIKGGDWTDGNQWTRMHEHGYLPTEESVGNAWAYCFSAVGTINNTLKSFGGSAILRAELETLRAMVYLWLIDAYGNVPIITETSTDPTPATKTRAEVYAFIESSVVNNLANLPKTKTYSTVNWYVGQAILAKLYINASVYTGTPQHQKAVDAAEAIIASGLYSLESDYFANFKSDNAGSKENIFVINYDKVNGEGFNLPQMTLHYSSQATFNLAEQPWNGYASLEDFYNSYDNADKRKKNFLAGPQFSSAGVRLQDNSFETADPDGADLTFTPFISAIKPKPGNTFGSLRQQGARVGKFEFPTGSTRHLSNDFPIFRYADVLLMKAEALWRISNGSAEALTLVNQVRTRAGIPALVSLTAADLLAERGREMFAEGYRRSDLVRFGKYNDAWWEKPTSVASKNIFPIPQGQILVNTKLVQNPGY
jgi:starch-binding outer membrane protein, SusD/RagB family